MGLPIFNITWYKDNQLITAYPTIYTDVSNTNRTGTLTVAAASITDAGFYKCVLANHLGSVTSESKYVNIQCKYTSL